MTEKSTTSVPKMFAVGSGRPWHPACVPRYRNRKVIGSMGTVPVDPMPWLPGFDVLVKGHYDRNRFNYSPPDRRSAESEGWQLQLPKYSIYHQNGLNVLLTANTYLPTATKKPFTTHLALSLPILQIWELTIMAMGRDGQVTCITSFPTLFHITSMGIRRTTQPRPWIESLALERILEHISYTWIAVRRHRVKSKSELPVCG